MSHRQELVWALSLSRRAPKSAPKVMPAVKLLPIWAGQRPFDRLKLPRNQFHGYRPATKNSATTTRPPIHLSVLRS